LRIKKSHKLADNDQMKMVCEIWRKEPIAPSYQQEEALTSYT
jgi:hypothetical protein